MYDFSKGDSFLVKKTGQVTRERCPTNPSFLLFSSFFCSFVVYCFTSTVSSTPSDSCKELNKKDDRRERWESLMLVSVTLLSVFSRAIPLPECNCKPVTLSKQPHALLQLCFAVPVCGSQHRSHSRTDHKVRRPQGPSLTQQTSHFGFASRIARGSQPAIFACLACIVRYKSKWPTLYRAI